VRDVQPLRSAGWRPCGPALLLAGKVIRVPGLALSTVAITASCFTAGTLRDPNNFGKDGARHARNWVSPK
jgi:hypothetical protein